MKRFELENQAKINTGFTTPENYFDDFSKKIQARILEEKPSQKIFFLQPKNWIYAVAAVLVIGISIPFFSNETNTIKMPSVSVIDNYISNEAAISEDEMMVFLDAKDLEKMSLENNLNTKEMTDELLKVTDLEQNLID